MITHQTAEISRTYGADNQREDTKANKDSCTLTPACPRRRNLGPGKPRAGFGEHTICQAIDHRGITPRSNRDQRHTLCGEEVRSAVQRQLITNESLDLFTVELLDVQMRCEPFREKVGHRLPARAGEG